MTAVHSIYSLSIGCRVCVYNMRMIECKEVLGIVLYIYSDSDSVLVVCEIV